MPEDRKSDAEATKQLVLICLHRIMVQARDEERSHLWVAQTLESLIVAVVVNICPPEEHDNMLEVLTKACRQRLYRLRQALATQAPSSEAIQ